MSRAKPRLRARRLLPALAVMAACVVLYASPGAVPWLDWLEGQSLTARFRLRGPVAPGPDVVMVAIDNDSIAARGAWPPVRADLARLVDMLAADGARVIAFDLLLGDRRPDMSRSLAAALREARDALAGSHPALAARLAAALHESGADRRLEGAIAAAGNVIVPFAFVYEPAERPAGGAGSAAAIEGGAYRVVHRPAGYGGDPWPEPAGLLTPAEGLARQAAGLAHVSVIVEADGSLRADAPALAMGDSYYPSLPIEAVRLFRELPKGAVSLRLGEGVVLGDRLIRTGHAMRLPINYYGPAGTIESHAFHDVLARQVPPGTFAGRVVVIGTTAAAAGDMFATPFSQTLPGSEFHATVIDNILTGRLPATGEAAAVPDLAAIAAMATAGLAFLVIPSLAGRLALLALGLGLWWTIVAVAFVEAQLWLNAVLPTLALLAGFAWFGTVRGVADQRARREAERQRSNLSRYLPPALVERLAESDEPFALDRTQHAAMLFIDIAGFTALSQRLSPADAMALLRVFYARVEAIVASEGGMLDKFLGDGALAVFGAGRPELGDAVRAASCARALAADIEAWRAELEAAGRPPVAVRIGLHYGPVLLGALGGARQFQVTVIGDAVNVASRLTDLCRVHDAAVIASDTLVEAARAAGGAAAVSGFEPLAAQEIRGRDREIGLWAWRGGSRGCNEERVLPVSVADTGLA